MHNNGDDGVAKIPPNGSAEDLPGRRNDRLLNKMWRTKSSLFNASQRLRAKHNLSIWATSLLSFYVFCTSLAAVFIPILQIGGDPPRLSQDYSIAALPLSLFLIIVTLMENSKTYLKEAESKLKTGNRIGELYNLFQAYDLETREKKRVECTNRYSKILQTMDIEHRDMDYLKFQIRYSESLGLSKRQKCLNIAKFSCCYLGEYAVFIFMIGSPLLFVLYLLARY